MTLSKVSEKGFVALIVGGDSYGPAVEIYSPEGKCQHRLPDIPIRGSFLHIPTLSYINGKIMSCAGHSASQNNTVSKSTFSLNM